MCKQVSNSGDGVQQAGRFDAVWEGRKLRVEVRQEASVHAKQCELLVTGDMNDDDQGAWKGSKAFMVYVAIGSSCVHGERRTSLEYKRRVSRVSTGSAHPALSCNDTNNITNNLTAPHAKSRLDQNLGLPLALALKRYTRSLYHQIPRICSRHVAAMAREFSLVSS